MVTLRTTKAFMFAGACLLASFGATSVVPAGKKPVLVQPKKSGSKALAEWTFITYIQADNNLADFAVYNISDMQKVTIPSSVNVLVQWDQPRNNKTWRYKIVKGGRIDVGSLSVEMGQNPADEIIDMMSWAKTNYDAKKWCVTLWNHGNGILDRSSLTPQDLVVKLSTQWLQVPGMSSKPSSSALKERGILYDDSQGTFMNNQEMARAFAQVKTILGQNVDVVGMDACLMAMLEVGYQIKQSANYLVGSEALEPGQGWNYSGLLTTLCARPTMSAKDFAGAIVKAYGDFYRKINDPSITQSSIDLSKLQNVVDANDALVDAVYAMKALDSARTLAMVRDARSKTLSFEVPSYIDLVSFYTRLIEATSTFTKTTIKITGARPLNQTIKDAATLVKQRASLASQAVKAAVTANVVGRYYAKASGMSVYFPRGLADSTYADTLFAQDTNWGSFIADFR